MLLGIILAVIIGTYTMIVLELFNKLTKIQKDLDEMKEEQSKKDNNLLKG